jgi:transcriptional regulator with XRE-family HTH domain
MNERLRTVMLQRGVAPEDLAAECQVDPKTVTRWINPGRVPHRQHRWKTAKRLDVDEVYLWPSVLDSDQARRREVTQSELIQVYPDRSSVSRDTWLRFLSEARECIDVLVFSGTFFVQTNPRVATMLAERAAAGVRVRLCFGDPASQAIDIRDREEGLRGTLAAKIRASLTYYRELVDVEGCEVRLHGATLYASLFRYDDDMVVNPHVWGQPASANPVLHLRRLDGAGWFDRYAESFHAVWKTAAPWKPGEETT